MNSRSNNDEVRQKYYNMALEICDNKGYKLLSNVDDFKGYKQNIQYICSKHGIKSIRFGNLCSGRGCIDCQQENIHIKNVLPLNEVKRRIESLGGKILNLEEYYNSTTENLLIECPRCHKNNVKTSLRYFTQHGGQVCSNCFRKESNGERKIREWLESKNIYFEQQKYFSDCRDIHPLPFDFYIRDKNAIIEFDGKQHFEDSHFFNHSDTRFGNTLSYIQYHDSIKTNYCKDNGIHLLRIPYNKINEIDDLLSNFLSA